MNALDRRKTDKLFQQFSYPLCATLNNRESKYKNHCVEMFLNLCTHSSRDLSHACITHSRTQWQNIVQSSLTVYRPLTLLTLLVYSIQGCHPELVIMPRFLKCIFVLSSEFSEYVGWTYNMSHGRVSTLLPPSRPISRVSLSRDRMSIARERGCSRSPCLVRQVSRASSCSTKCSLADPNFPFPPQIG